MTLAANPADVIVPAIRAYSFLCRQHEAATGGIIDKTEFHVADNVAYHDRHVKLTEFPGHAWAKTDQGWE